MNYEKLCWIWLWNRERRHAWKQARRVTTHYNGRYIYSGREGNDVVLRKLQEGRPCSIARFGGNELETLACAFDQRPRRSMVFPDYLKARMKHGAGFFSNTDELLTRFASEMFQAVRRLDLLAVWNFRTDAEKRIVETYNPTATLVGLDAVSLETKEGYPWSQYLTGKKVLVIHPFESTIRQQYATKREKIHRNPLILPEFDLRTLRAVQGIGSGEELKRYADWFEALNSMCLQIDAIDFDVALIGAGAYGLLLADYVKRKGKQAVHMGGVTQLLFGIIGERWEKEHPDSCKKYVNEHWVHPLPEDTPLSLEKIIAIEDCKAYW